MQASTQDPGGAFANTDAFVVANTRGDTLPGVASLDSPALQQTKSEIRSLAAELAQLAHTALDPHDFYEGFLPRLCGAMGAKGAGVWRIERGAAAWLIAGHSLPSSLLRTAASVTSDRTSTGDSDQFAPQRSTATLPSESHQRILQCVVAEGQPILVPPGNVTLDAERPTNPLSDALIVIPIRTEENVEYLLEVIQRPSGGPAAQRGYLRFVAQMGDLMADYLRRQQLREYSAERDRLQRIEGWLTTIATETTANQRQQLAADAMVDLFSAERVLLIAHRFRSQVVAVSGARGFDPRSEVVLAAQALHAQVRQRAHQTNDTSQPTPFASLQFEATDRRHPTPTDESAQSVQGVSQLSIDRLCDALACRQGMLVALDEPGNWCAILTSVEKPSPAIIDLSDQDGKELRLLRSIGGLLQASLVGVGWRASTWVRPLLGLTNNRSGRKPGQRSLFPVVQCWLLRGALLGLITAVTLFPVTQQISATAILQPLSKQMYYAPASGIVTEVLVDEGDAVVIGTPLLRLTSHELETQQESLQLELKKTQGQISEKSSRLHRGEALSSLEKDQLEYDLRELETTLDSIELRSADNAQQLSELTLTARQAGTISTWDLHNRLLNHPVQAGQLLATTFDATDKWRLQLSIPDYRAGLVAAALERAPHRAVPVQFSLASHPDQILEAFAVDMAPQVTVDNNSATSTSRVVRTEAYIRDSNTLPLKKDGAIARATIDCGKVPLCWLVFRDAYWAISSRVRMLW